MIKPIKLSNLQKQSLISTFILLYPEYKHSLLVIEENGYFTNGYELNIHWCELLHQHILSLNKNFKLLTD
jgi:hypothetical protein